MPDEQEFRQRLRGLAVNAMRDLIEEDMREELEQCIGAASCVAKNRGGMSRA